MSEAIRSFKGAYGFLSNFYPGKVEYEGMEYPTVEHAFQAAKTLDMEKRKAFQTYATPASAKSRGKRVPLRPDWEDVKIGIMKEIVRDKFVRNDSDMDLKGALLLTGDAYLEEGNTHGDRFWGTVKGEGRNELGKILMEVREELKNQG
ncbi:MAG: NADAR family protein [Clostridia bacterium]|nr:NADAR family protein [Clostridia bacterium]